MSSIRKLVAREHAAYEATVSASAAAVMIAHAGGVGTPEHDAAVRRAGALRSQWLAASRLLEEAEDRASSRVMARA